MLEFLARRIIFGAMLANRYSRRALAMAFYTPAEAAAALAQLKALEQADVPWYEQSAITDELLNQIVDACLTAAAKVRVTAQQGS